MGDPSTVHLLDAHVYVFRAWFSLPEMSAPDGTPTNAAYGFTNTLIRYLVREDPTHLACAFDFALTSFRNERFPGYKASRGEEAPPSSSPSSRSARRPPSRSASPCSSARTTRPTT